MPRKRKDVQIVDATRYRPDVTAPSCTLHPAERIRQRESIMDKADDEKIKAMRSEEATFAPKLQLVSDDERKSIHDSAYELALRHSRESFKSQLSDPRAFKQMIKYYDISFSLKYWWVLVMPTELGNRIRAAWRVLCGK